METAQEIKSIVEEIYLGIYRYGYSLKANEPLAVFLAKTGKDRYRISSARTLENKTRYLYVNVTSIKVDFDPDMATVVIVCDPVRITTNHYMPTTLTSLVFEVKNFKEDYIEETDVNGWAIIQATDDPDQDFKVKLLSGNT
jgi:hypothetical protein